MSNSGAPKSETHAFRPLRQSNDSEYLKRVTEIILQMPGDRRIAIVRAALDFSATTPLATSYAVGVLRSQLFDGLVECLGYVPRLSVLQAIDQSQLHKRIRSLAQAKDLIQTALIVSDLVTFLADACNSSHSPCALLPEEGNEYE